MIKQGSTNVPLCFLELSAGDLIVVPQNIYTEALTFNASLLEKGI